MRNIIFIILGVLFFSSLQAQQRNNKTIITDFWQTSVEVSPNFRDCSGDNNLGNCVAIGLIKLAIAQFGSMDKIFKKVMYLDDETLSIVFQDKDSLSITNNEINIVKSLSGIKPSTESKFYDDAIKIYTAMCKRIYNSKDRFSREGNCINNFTNAVEFLNSGYISSRAHDLLGLKSETVNILNVSKYESVYVWCSAHAAFVSYGIQDLAGKEIALRRTKMRNFRNYSKIKGAFILKSF